MSFCARLDRADQMATLLECLLMQNTDDVVHVVVDAANVEFHVLGRSKTTRARLTFPSGCFQAYEARDEHDNEFVDGADQEALAPPRERGRGKLSFQNLSHFVEEAIVARDWLE